MPAELKIQECDNAAAIVGELLQQGRSEENGSPLIGLSGGSLVNLLAANRESVVRAANEHDWRIFLIDERHVPLDDSESNFGQLKRQVFQDQGRLYGIRSDLGLEECAADYGRQFGKVCEERGSDRFDLVVMGVGPDGHCASLFPGHPAGDFVFAAPAELKSNANSDAKAKDPVDSDSGYVVAVRDAPKPPPNRISFTGPALAAARRIRVLMIGAAKKEILAKLIRNPEKYPAGRILLNHPDAKILADRSALS